MRVAPALSFRDSEPSPATSALAPAAAALVTSDDIRGTPMGPPEEGAAAASGAPAVASPFSPAAARGEPVKSPRLPISGSFHAITRMQASVRRVLTGRKYARVLVLASAARAKQHAAVCLVKLAWRAECLGALWYWWSRVYGLLSRV